MTDRPQSYIDDDECRRVMSVVEIIGRRWSSGILLAIGSGAERFIDILASVKGLSGRMLTVRLAELEDDLLVERIVETSRPVRIRYRITARGARLLAALQPLGRFAAWDETGGTARPGEERPSRRDAGAADPAVL